MPKIKYLAHSFNDWEDEDDKIADIKEFVIKVTPKYNPKRACYYTFISTYLKNYRYYKINKSITLNSFKPYTINMIDNSCEFPDNILLYSLEKHLNKLDYLVLIDYTVNELFLKEIRDKYYPKLAISTVRDRILDIIDNCKNLLTFNEYGG